MPGDELIPRPRMTSSRGGVGGSANYDDTDVRGPPAPVKASTCSARSEGGESRRGPADPRCLCGSWWRRIAQAESDRSARQRGSRRAPDPARPWAAAEAVLSGRDQPAARGGSLWSIPVHAGRTAGESRRRLIRQNASRRRRRWKSRHRGLQQFWDGGRPAGSRRVQAFNTQGQRARGGGGWLDFWIYRASLFPLVSASEIATAM